MSALTLAPSFLDVRVFLPIMKMSPDEATLVALGYKQEFKREFSLWSSFSVSFSVLGLLPSTASTLFVVPRFNRTDW
jgi:hypothetical protein